MASLGWILLSRTATGVDGEDALVRLEVDEVVEQAARVAAAPDVRQSSVAVNAVLLPQPTPGPPRRSALGP